MSADLSRMVIDFVDRAKARPGSDPTDLAILERKAREDIADSFAALHAPMAPHTWELRTQLITGATQSEAVAAQFGWPAEIVGMRPSIVVIPPPVVGVLVAPTMEDIDVAIDVNSENLVTTAQGMATVAGDRDGNFVSLPSIGIQSGRLHGLRLNGDTPTIRMQFRWVRGKDIYFDALVRVALMVRRIPTARR